MRALSTVFCKEFLENLRDRRTLFSALLFGPLFGPILFGAKQCQQTSARVVFDKQFHHVPLVRRFS